MRSRAQGLGSRAMGLGFRVLSHFLGKTVAFKIAFVGGLQDKA